MRRDEWTEVTNNLLSPRFSQRRLIAIEFYAVIRDPSLRLARIFSYQNHDRIAVLEMICQQRYRVAGVPVDLTPYRNHGIAIATSVEPGPTAAGDAIAFSGANSAVRIGLGTTGAWQPLTALKIEVDVCVPDPTVARTLCLVEGDGAFRFDIFEHAIEAVTFAGDGQQTYLRAADAFSPDHGFHPVPPNRWVTLGLYHDGFAKMQLTMDGKLVAETLVNGGVAGVSPGGVAIGNKLSDGFPLHGAISEVRIWRLDPTSLRREFLCRAINAETAQCLAAGFREVWAWIAEHPREAAAIEALIEARIAQTVRTLLLQADKKQEPARKALHKITQLWCNGHIAGDKMKAAQRAWAKALDGAGVSDTAAQDAAAIEDILLDIALPHISIHCDPQMKDFIRHLTKVRGNKHKKVA